MKTNPQKQQAQIQMGNKTIYHIVTVIILAICSCNDKSNTLSKKVKIDSIKPNHVNLLKDFDLVKKRDANIYLYILDPKSNDSVHWKEIVYDSNKISESYKLIHCLDKDKSFELLNILTSRNSYGHPESFGFDPSFAGIVYDSTQTIIGYFIIDLKGRSLVPVPKIIQQEYFKSKFGDGDRGYTLLSDLGIEKLTKFLRNNHLFEEISDQAKSK